MSKQQGLAIIFIAGLAMVFGGIRGILKRKVVANHAHLVLSVGQLITGLMSLAICLLLFLDYI